MKSGTTSLFEILSQHPQICPSKLKEPDYFIKDRDDKCRKDYLTLWDWSSISHVIALESSVAYTKAPFISGVPERISRAELGKYRFIYMLRDPLARIESQVHHGLFAGWGKSLDVEIPEDLIDFSRYAMQLKNYLEYFPKKNIMLVILEEFQHKPHVVLTQICEFLGVDSKFLFANVDEPRNSGELFNSSPIVASITQGKIGQFIAQKIIPTSIKSWLRNCIVNLGSRKKDNLSCGRWRLNYEERINILDSLADDMRKLESDFNVDIRKYWQVPPQIINKS